MLGRKVGNDRAGVIVDFREDRAERAFNFALECGCNVTMPMQRTVTDLLRALIDLQREHDCEPLPAT